MRICQMVKRSLARASEVVENGSEIDWAREEDESLKTARDVWMFLMHKTFWLIGTYPR